MGKKLNLKFNIYSFFSGAGFLDLGFEDAGYNIAFVNEFSEPFMEAYKYARKEMSYPNPLHGYYLGDINDLLRGNPKKMLHQYISEDRTKKKLVGFIGGPPCPDFSVAGKNKGIAGTNGRLTISFKRLILQEMPDFFVFENVKGLASTKKHKEEFKKIKEAFKRKNYVLTEKLINSLEYGAPQDRYRIILIGVRADILAGTYKEAKKILLTFDWDGTKRYKLETISSIKWPQKSVFNNGSVLAAPQGIIQELTVEYWFRKNKVYEHTNANDVFTAKAINRFKTIPEGDVSRKSFKRLHRWRYAPTAAYGNNEVHLHPYKERRLSVSEALAIQSLPAHFIIKPDLTLTQKFKMVGNGVPYVASLAIACKLKVFLERQVKGM